MMMSGVHKYYIFHLKKRFTPAPTNQRGIHAPCMAKEGKEGENNALGCAPTLYKIQYDMSQTHQI